MHYYVGFSVLVVRVSRSVYLIVCFSVFTFRHKFASVFALSFWFSFIVHIWPVVLCFWDPWFKVRS